ncbi:hypothetical protein GC722_16580 [Auraticoccus sp. F435]|uniref:Uncharacterized protein n=1 Tax=Auraticoccus cholistanensis TaxID=2656650 RepID=A0A6A9V1Z0_9ACTN|nr:polysialyltransferase family glycosyltransferase [Auraticoccus cholistanensis]MVA77620.1 hypothetical protein [Auraticoccus cholistanensis]
MKHLVVASTSYQLLCLAAAADAGVFEGGETVLVLADGSQLPELTTPLGEVAGFDRLVERFDRVVDLGALLLPRRPVQFSPRQEELSTWEALLRSHWGLGEERITLWLDAIQVNPGTALARIFFDAVLNAHADGLMAYGPTRTVLPLALQQRVDTVLHLDLVPGLRPLMLAECSPRLLPLDPARLAAVVAERDPAETAAEVATVQRFVAGHPAPRVALLLGQYLSRLGLLDLEEEAALHREMVAEAGRQGVTHCLFKPHPAAGPAQAEALAAHARELGLRLLVLDSPVQAELLFPVLRPALVVSAFSTGLATADAVFGLQVRAVGTELLLDRLTPYQNSNRVPLTLVDARYGQGLPAPDDAPADLPLAQQLQPLLVAVAYCMQSQNLAGRRAEAEAYLAAAVGTEQMRYFKRRRLLSLGLPGAPAGAGHPRVRALRRAVARRWPRLHQGARRVRRRLARV